MLQARCAEALHAAESIAPRLAGLDHASAQRFRMHIALLRAAGSAMSDDPESVLAVLADSAIDARGHRLGRLLLRYGYWRLSRWSALYALPEAGDTESSCDAVTRIFDLTVLAVAALERLQLITASRFAADAMTLARDHGLDDSIAAASAAVVLATVRYELGYVDHAEELILGRMPTIRALGMPDAIIQAYWLLSRIAQHRGQHNHASLVLNDGQRLGEARSSARIVLTLMREKVRMLAMLGETDLAQQTATAMRRYAYDHPTSPHVGEQLEQLCTLACSHANRSGEAATDAVRALEQRLCDAMSADRLHTGFHLALELSEALCARGLDDAAEPLLLQLLERSERAGLLQCWIDANPACGAILARVAVRSANVQWIALKPYLRTVLEHRGASQHTRQRSRSAPVRSCEHLSSRERVVLALIAKGQSNKRVAQALSVTPETIKSHLKRVFVKLGAKTRAEAVLRATDLGQLLNVAVPTLHRSENTYA
jgi:LuxR family maltose regulon positive regulatory protein